MVLVDTLLATTQEIQLHTLHTQKQTFYIFFLFLLFKMQTEFNDVNVQKRPTNTNYGTSSPFSFFT